MPVSRSGTMRVKAPRSPAAPPRTPNSSTPTFMPPSYYAAAANSTRYHTHYGIEDNEDHAKPSSKGPTPSHRFAGISAAPPPSSSDSSLVEHIPDLRHRQNSRNGFTELESQLLPSLRDTIDRMTGATPRGNGQGELPETLKREGRSRSSRLSPELRTTPTTKHREPSRNHYQQFYEEPATPHPSHAYYDPSTPTIANTPSRLRTPGKSVLKSSLKSPAINTPPISDNTPHAGGSSLRTMKSLLTRKCSGSLMSPFSSNGSKSRERTPVPTDRYPPAEDQPQSRPSSRSQPRFQSSIPRPRQRRYQGDQHEESDFERQFEQESRDRRKLTVANAEVSASASSSESDTEGHKSNRGRRFGYEGDSTRPVGLGLSFSPSPVDSRQSPNFPQTKNLRFSLPPSESAGSSYSDDFSRPQDGESNTQHELNDGSDLDSYFTKSPPRSPTSTRQELTTDAETESEREGYTIKRSRAPGGVGHTRGRSSSCAPSFRASPPKEEEYPPPRPQSACQRREPSRTDREFPPNLRELIKSRNSFAKPAALRKEEEQFIPTTAATAPRRPERESKHGGGRTKVNRTSTSPEDRDRGRSRRRISREQKTEAAAIAEGYRSAAARERMAFGIPPSDSDDGVAEEDHRGHLPHGDSNMSSINESIWRAEGDDVSLEAENILRNVGISSKEKGKERIGNRLRISDTPRLSVISPTLSASSTYDERMLPDHHHNQQWNGGAAEYETEDSSWKTAEEGSSNSREIASSQPDGLPPYTREGVIQEIFETEEELLRLLHICMQMFILPLRVQNSRSWIEGVPRNVARLLDWFDDIVNLHEQIYQGLCSARDTMSPATDRVSESLRWFVLKVEVYQPYLVRLGDVTQEIVALMDNKKSDLGQFICLQERSAECRGWTFERLLMLPVNRLASYQDLFVRMLDLTPKTHQDYLSTLSLSRSTDIVVKVMTEVKIREDEYSLLKAFCSRIQGLSPSSGLATRERRLLHSGPLQLVLSTLTDPSDIGIQKQTLDARRISRSSRLLDALSKPKCDTERPASLKSGSSSSSSGTNFPPDLPASSLPHKSSWLSRLPLRKKSVSRNKSPSPTPMPDVEEGASLSPDISLRTLDLNAFVFNDLVLLARQARSSDPEPSWILSEDLGIFRPLSIARIRRRNAQEGTIFSLEAAVLDPGHLNDGTDFRTSAFRIVDLLIPPPSPTASAEGTDSSSSDPFQPWFSSLRQCSKTTLRKLTFVGPASQEGCTLGSDQLLDTHLVVSTLMGSGLPIPRSPSGHFPDTLGGTRPDAAPSTGDEREERGWWSLRYQQVFRELHRLDSVLSDDENDV